MSQAEQQAANEGFQVTIRHPDGNRSTHSWDGDGSHLGTQHVVLNSETGKPTSYLFNPQRDLVGGFTATPGRTVIFDASGEMTAVVRAATPSISRSGTAVSNNPDGSSIVLGAVPGSRTGETL